MNNAKLKKLRAAYDAVAACHAAYLAAVEAAKAAEAAWDEYRAAVKAKKGGKP